MVDKGQPQRESAGRSVPRGVELAELAARQYGVVSIRQLETSLGFSREAVRKAVRAGRLHPVHCGVYAVGHTVLSKRGRCLAAVLAVGPGSLLSYWTAGWLWGLIRVEPTEFHVTAPGPRRLRDRTPVHVHRARNLVDEDRGLEEGIPVTSLARTYLDLAEVAQPRLLPKLLQRGEDMKLLDALAIHRCAERSRGHRGAKPLLRALAIYQPPARVLRSGPERRFLALLEAAGLPLPASNYFVAGHEVDAYWEEHALAVEIDTYGTHGGRASFESDRERDADLTEAGIATIRVTEQMIDHQPAAVVRRMRRVLRPDAAPRRRASRPSPV